MKLLGKSTAETLARSRANLTDLAAQIAELQHRRDAALAGDGDIEAVAAIDRQADEQGRRLRALQDKISLLEGRLASEALEQREADYKAWAARVEATLPACRAADEKYERAKLAIGEAIKEVVQSRENALRVYRQGDCQPETVFVGYYLSSEPLASDIQRTWQIERGYADRYRPPSPSEYLTRGCDVGPRGYLTAMRERLDEFIVAVKTAHDPPPAETENETEGVAA
jgi:hypothetical protein